MRTVECKGCGKLIHRPHGSAKKNCPDCFSQAMAAAARGRFQPMNFHDMYEPVPEAGCWLWTGSTIHGYGRLALGERGKYKRGHRVSYEMHKGPIPDGMLVCHKCDTPRCVNPDHLFLGTSLDNHRDMVAKGRARPGFKKAVAA